MAESKLQQRMVDDRSELTDKARSVQRWWFHGLTDDERAAVILPAFMAAHPNNAAIRETARRHDEWVSEYNKATRPVFIDAPPSYALPGVQSVPRYHGTVQGMCILNTKHATPGKVLVGSPSE